MDAATDCFVSGFLAQVLRLARIFGVAPLRFLKEKTGWRVHLSLGWSIYGYCFVTAVILLAVCAVIFDIFIEQNHSYYMQDDTLRIVWLTELFVTMMIAGTSAFKAPKSMRSMISCLNHVQKINLEVNIRQWPESKHTECRKNVLLIIIISVNVILRCIDVELYLNQDEPNIYKLYMFYHFGTWITQMQLALIVMTTHHVVYSFKAINHNLKLMLYDWAHSQVNYDKKMQLILDLYKLPMNEKYNNVSYNDESKVSTVLETKHSGSNKSPSNHEKINSLAQVYVSTCDVVRELDRCHGLVVLMLLASYLFYLVITPYYLIDAVLHEGESENKTIDFIKGVLELMWCIVHLSHLIVLIEPCHLTHVEMDMTHELVSHLMFCSHSVYDPMAVELERFSRHLMLNQTYYTPMKVVTLQRSLVATILGSITTYLVIIFEL